MNPGTTAANSRQDTFGQRKASGSAGTRIGQPNVDKKKLEVVGSKARGGARREDQDGDREYGFEYLMKCVDENVGKLDADANADNTPAEHSNARIRQLMHEEEKGYNSIKQLLNQQVSQINQKLFTTADGRTDKMNSDIAHTLTSPGSNPLLNQKTPMGTRAIDSFKMFDLHDAGSSTNQGSQQQPGKR